MSRADRGNGPSPRRLTTQRPTRLALAGRGQGARACSLTDTVVKPALPVGGTYRLIPHLPVQPGPLPTPGRVDGAAALPHHLNFTWPRAALDLDRSHGG
ncbi:hypothetical protein QJS66_23030 [Kocuria rhizophila]|nr:hypothetical protein QJS66_23030 [Kocuria rhizophila]